MSNPTKRRLALLRIALLAAMGRRNNAYLAAERAIRIGTVSVRQCAELFLHLSLLLGVPTTLEALASIHRLSLTWSFRQHADSAARGMRTFRRIYGSQAEAVLRSMRSIDPFLPSWIIRDVYGGIFSRGGLGLVDREVITFSVLAYQGFDPQCHSHLRGARRLGQSRDAIRMYLRHVQKLTGRSMSRFIRWIHE